MAKGASTVGRDVPNRGGGISGGLGRASVASVILRYGGAERSTVRKTRRSDPARRIPAETI
jgi:hypothetical protein